MRRFSYLMLLYFVSFLASTTSFAQTLTPQQKQVIADLEKQEKKIEHQLGLDKSKKPLLRKKSKLLWDDVYGYTTKDFFGDKDLTKYEDGGTFHCGYWKPSSDQLGCDDNKIREFIWQHWESKKLGYVRINSCGADTCGTSHYFIELSKDGEVQVVWHYAGWHALGAEEDVRGYIVFNSAERISGKNGEWTLTLKDITLRHRLNF